MCSNAPRHRCVPGQPLQALHPKCNARRFRPGRQLAQGASIVRPIGTAEEAAARSARSGIVLIFDEVLSFPSRRKAPRNFGVHADMVTYGKSLAGGLPSASSAAAKGMMAPFPRRPSRAVCLPAHLQSASLLMTAMDESWPARSPNFNNVYQDSTKTLDGRAVH